jgi:RHS repeat-associated protein
MIWRVILFWLVSVTLVSADLPRHISFDSVACRGSAPQYDANGNLTNDGTRVFSYDAENQLTNIFVTNTWQVGFVYDGLNRRRIEKDFTWSSGWVETNEIHFIYDGMLVLQERASNNTPQVTYTRGLDLSLSRHGAGGIGGLLARSDSSGSYYYHADGNGNITALFDGNGNMAARAEYDAFGKMIKLEGPLSAINRYWYSSKELIPQPQIYSYGRRFYEPSLQRFLNRDPIQEWGGLNLYTSFGNSPLSYVDRYGLSWWNPFSWFGSSQASSQAPAPNPANSANSLVDPDDVALDQALANGDYGRKGFRSICCYGSVPRRRRNGGG